MLFLFIVLFLIMLIYYFTKTRRALHMLQQNSYNENNRYIKWVMNNTKASFLYLDILGLVALIPVEFITGPMLKNIWLIVLIALYILALYNLLNIAAKDQNKKPLVTTSRIKRMWVTLIIIFFIPVIVGLLIPSKLPSMALNIGILLVISYFLVYIANIINYPVERLVFHHYRHRACQKLKTMNNLKVIGITGSYGKTSSKNILNDILNTKYISLPSPKNFNTDYGLIMTINNYLDKFDDVFIAEMGAYAKGDIASLCKLVNPKYGILTTIGTAHLETFGSEENIIKTKFELIESLPKDGVAVLNKDDIKQVNYPFINKVRKIWIGIDNKDADIYASNIYCTSEGTIFDVYFKDLNETYSFQTKLLGKHSVYNILSSLALGLEFGITIKELIIAVKKVKPVEHRLELKKLGNMYQIDDAYNANPIGAQMALEVLDMMPGTKVVVTPGMVELGAKETDYNRIFGKQISEVANYVILIGKMRTIPIYEGLISKGYKKDNIFILDNVREAYPLILSLKTDKDIYALFENDLPDTYNE
ncbi:MAG: UDP-N-acetylmuramoyl-tripeptide--D-alanyl-D-alanine ligase [Bacilli bacterium]